jgi:hypothetical protein
MASTSLCNKMQFRSASVSMRGSRLTRTARVAVRPQAYSITVKMPTGEATFECAPDKYIIAAAEVGCHSKN